MEGNTLQKCRTCLNTSTKLLALTERAKGCHGRTYNQLFQEYTKLEECDPNYERLMPNNLCNACCRQLRNIYIFICQAKKCNKKLLKTISTQLDCLEEKAICINQNENDLEHSFDIKEENETNDCYQKLGTTKTTQIDCLEEKTIDFLENDRKLEKSFDVKEENKIKDCSSLTDLKTEGITIDDLKAMNPIMLLQTEIMEQETDDDTSFRIDENNDEPKVDQNGSNLKDKNEEKSSKSQSNLECPICTKIMSRRYNLLAHMRKKHQVEEPNKLLDDSQESQSANTFKCKICSSKFVNRKDYLDHIKDKHYNNGKVGKEEQKHQLYKCYLCEYKAKSSAALNYHKLSKHGCEKDQFKCKFCSKVCLGKLELIRHVKNEHKELIKTLKAKSKSIVEKGDAFNDLSTCKQNEHLLDLGQNEDSSSNDDIPLAKRNIKYQLTTDLSTNTKTKVEKEDVSDEEFIRDLFNIKNKPSKSLTKSLARRCNECGKVYKNHSALYAHQRYVHISEEKRCVCPHCGKKLKRKTSLTVHIKNTHVAKNSTETKKPLTAATEKTPKVKEKKFMCTECSYVCGTITTLTYHINRHHTGEKPYKCDICFKAFVVPHDLKLHRYVHFDEKPYKCSICSKGFQDKAHLRKHQRIHSSVPPYQCDECGKRFTQSYNLLAHKRLHMKHKNLNCTICDKVFENFALLNMHRIKENHQD